MKFPIDEVKKHLTEEIIPFWVKIRDDEFGGYYGVVDSDLNVHKDAVKGCILNSRILWFFSNAYMTLGDEALLKEADHAYEFLRDHCIDRTYGGVYWAMNYDGTPNDDVKHTYNMAFAIYALSAYYDATKKKEALDDAMGIYRVIEEKCYDGEGYLESFSVDFVPGDNEKLSDGFAAVRTQNTMLHLLEGYTGLLRSSHDPEVAASLKAILMTEKNQIFNPEKRRQDCYFDAHFNVLNDVHSYGHDIEASWLFDEACDVLQDPETTEAIHFVTEAYADEVLKTAFDGRSLANEFVDGEVDETRIWWVEAEAAVGFMNAYQKFPERAEFLEASIRQWEFIRDYMIDSRSGEWFSSVSKDGTPNRKAALADMWKCPYHNGRMCMELIRRCGEIA